MRAKIIWLPPALQDLENVPYRKAERILEKVELLSEFPEMGSKMFFAWEGYRQLIVGNYRVIYEVVTPRRVEIAYIRHTRQKL